MTQLSLLTAEPPEQDGNATADPPTAAEDEPRPGTRVPSLGVLETRPLTDREREVAYAAIMWRAMHGGC